jgi:hypothetical protein
MNNLPNIIINKSKLVLFADDTSITVTKISPKDYKNNITKIFENINDCFKVNLLILHFDKTYYIQFITNNRSVININIGYDSKLLILQVPNFLDY